MASPDWDPHLRISEGLSDNYPAVCLNVVYPRQTRTDALPGQDLCNNIFTPRSLPQENANSMQENKFLFDLPEQAGGLKGRMKKQLRERKQSLIF